MICQSGIKSPTLVADLPTSLSNQVIRDPKIHSFMVGKTEENYYMYKTIQ